MVAGAQFYFNDKNIHSLVVVVSTLRISSRLFLTALSMLSRDSWLTSESKLPYGGDNNSSSPDISILLLSKCVM